MSDDEQDIWTRGGIQCKAKSKGSQKRCRRPATPGHLVCKLHGSASPQAKARVERERLMAEVEVGARKALDKLGFEPVQDPLTELQRLGGEVVAWKDLLRTLVDELQQKYRYEGEHAEQIRGEVLLFERALDRCAMVLGLIARLKIDDRLVAIEEAKVTQIVDAVEAALDALGLSVEQQLEAKAEVARTLRVVG